MKFALAVAQIDPRPGELSTNLQMHLELAREAAGRGAQCIAFPELSLTGYHLPDGYAHVALSRDHSLLEPLFELSRQIDLLFGLVLESSDHVLYNAVLYLAGGRVLAEHRKVYLPTYGEFEEGKHLGRGDRFSAFATAAGRAGILICEENWHPSAAYLLWIDHAVVLYSLHCSSTPVASRHDLGSSMASVRQLNQFYSKIFGCYVICANRAGQEGPYHFWGGSEIVDPFGQVEQRAKEFETDLLVHTIDTDKIRQARLSLPLRRDEDVHLTLRHLSQLTRSPQLDEHTPSAGAAAEPL